MERGLYTLRDYILNKTGKDPIIKYKYVTEKSLYVIIEQYISPNLRKDFETYVSLLFNLDNIRQKGNNVIYSNKDVRLNIVDPSKLNYKEYMIFTNYARSVNLKDTKCHNYFCDHKKYEGFCFFEKMYYFSQLYKEVFNRARSIDLSLYGSPLLEVSNIILNKGLNINLNKGLTNDNLCEYIHATGPSESWITSQITYLENLEYIPKSVLRLYTMVGDKLINGYIRNGSNLNSELITYFNKNYHSNFVETYELLMGKLTVLNEISIGKYIRKLINIIRSVIENSPPLDKPFYVYRGRTDKLSLKEGDYVTTDSFTSTSVYVSTAVRFSKSKKYVGSNITSEYGTILRYKIKGKCLFMSESMYLSEFEVLINFSERYVIKRKIANAEFIDSLTDDIRFIDYIEFN